MYLDFYGLKEPPFSSSPPRFLFLGEEHKEALAFLNLCIRERKGFILLTGEEGTGKTTVLQALVPSLGPDVLCVHISDSMLTAKEFFVILARKLFHQEACFRNKAEFLIAFEEFLKACQRQQKTFVMIFDEAHNLSFRLLEEIRLLSNMVTGEENLMAILLIGQPELNKTLSRPECLPVLQRISLRYHLKPLDHQATNIYVETRLRAAGATSEIFTQEAINVIHECSRGYPRIINLLAESALLLGYAEYKKKITADMIRKCHQEMQVTPESPDKAEIEPKPKKVEIEPVLPARRRDLRQAFAAISVLILLALTAFPWREGVVDDIREMLRAQGLFPAARTKLEEPSSPPEKGVEGVKRFSIETQAQDLDAKVHSAPVADVATEPIEPAVEGSAAPEAEAVQKAGTQTVKVRRGDTVRKLSRTIYGRADQEVLEWVKKANPGLTDINHVLVGQTLIFPPIQRLVHKPDTKTTK